jgi:hypothetical protein
MSIVRLAVVLVVIIAIAAVVIWFTRSSGITIPQPLLIVIYAAVAIIAIIFLASLAGMGPVAVRW